MNFVDLSVVENGEELLALVGLSNRTADVWLTPAKDVCKAVDLRVRV